MEPEKIILATDENAARFITNISGWVDINNMFFGNHSESERLARHSSATHSVCECGKLMKKYWLKCDDCREKLEIESYLKLPFKEWDECSMVYSHSMNRYFNDRDDIDEFCDEEDDDIDPKDFRLVLCEPNYFHPIDSSIWEDVLPEDYDTFPHEQELQRAISTFNSEISKLPPVSYRPGKIRTEYLGYKKPI